MEIPQSGYYSNELFRVTYEMLIPNQQEMECGKVALQYWYPQVKLQELQDIKK